MKLRAVLVCAGVSALIAMGTVRADDPAAWDWTGFYVGLHAGYGFGDQSVRLGGSPDVEYGIEAGFVPRKLDTDPDGFMGGVQIGANRQMDNLVVGLEIDASLSGISGSDAKNLDPGIPVPVPTVPTRVKQDLDGFGTARLRIGVTFDRLLVYGTGGVALGRSKFSVRVDPELTDALLERSSKETSAGWTAGGGIEYALNETVSLKGEYLYYDLGSEKVTATDISETLPDHFVTAKFSVNGHMVRGGVNVRF